MSFVGYCKSSSKSKLDDCCKLLSEQNLINLYTDLVDDDFSSPQPNLHRMLEYLREGDCIVVVDLTTLTKDSLTLANALEFAVANKVSIKSLREDLVINDAGTVF